MATVFTEKQIQEFWRNYDRFLHANLITEAPHPKTHNLSYLCQTNIAAAFNLFKHIELEAISCLYDSINYIRTLQRDIKTCLDNNNKIFIVGCGASGRVALLLKRLWQYYHPEYYDSVISVIAAGDIALIKSVEQFEDNKDFGVRQILQQGFTDKDLLIGLSASGESPFVISSVAHAANNSIYSPYLVFNNSQESLLIRNPKHILLQQSVNALELNVGSMVLTGSTRLQATTAMHIALGIILCKLQCDIQTELDIIYKTVSQLDLTRLTGVANREANYLAHGEYILYQTNDPLLGLSILADSTECSPTFNLTPYENKNDKRTTSYSPFYLSLTNINSAKKVWEFLLGEAALCLNWAEFKQTSNDYINGFDLSSSSRRSMGTYLTKPQHHYRWIIEKDQLHISLDTTTVDFTLTQDPLIDTLIYKICLNSNSTLVFGQMGYFTGNIMISLAPSNFKLIDRAIRYSQFILNHTYRLNIEYKALATIMFKEMSKLSANQSIVNNVVKAVINQNVAVT